MEELLATRFARIAGCPIGFDKRHGCKAIASPPNPSHLLPPSYKSSMSAHRNLHASAHFKPQEENRRIKIEAFNCSTLDDLCSLESYLASKTRLNNIELPPNINTMDFESSEGSHWLSRFFNKQKKSSASYKKKQTAKFDQSQTLVASNLNQRYHSLVSRKHRRILTPRCDTSLVTRMERTTAIVLLQRCLRGRAAQISMAQARLRVLEMYDELIEFEDSQLEMKKEQVDEKHDHVVRALVEQLLVGLFNSYAISNNEEHEQ